MRLQITLASLAFAAVPALLPAQAQEADIYAGVGYSHLDADDATLGGITGRLGVGFGPYFGIEGEATFGVNDDEIGGIDVELENQFGIYGVGRLPVSPQFELFGRIGYASAEVEASAGGFSASGDGDGLAYGAGGTFFLTDVDGIRGEYTRFDFDDGEADVWAASYIRRF
jgi:hypothetical protein